MFNHILYNVCCLNLNGWHFLKDIDLFKTIRIGVSEYRITYFSFDIASLLLLLLLVQQQWWSWWSSSGPPSPNIMLVYVTFLKNMLGCLVLLTTGTRWGRNDFFSFLCTCALSLLWPERSRAKTTWPGLSRRWYASFSCLGFSVFWWWWSFPGTGCWSSCASHLGSWSACSLPVIPHLLWSIGEQHVLPSSCICVARRGDLFIWRASNTDNASVRKTVGEHGSKDS